MRLVSTVTRFCVLLPSPPHAGCAVGTANIEVARLFREDQIYSGHGLQR